MPIAAFLARRHLTWHTWLDLPVGFDHVSSDVLGTIHFQGPGPDDARYRPGTVPGWLVLLGITNPGWAPVRSSDFSVPLAFAFPGRQVITARASAEPAPRRDRVPMIQLPAGSPETHPDDRGPDRIHLAGGFRLRPGDRCTLTLLLTGTPTPHCPPVQQDGTLTTGRITSDPGMIWL